MNFSPRPNKTAMNNIIIARVDIMGTVFSSNSQFASVISLFNVYSKIVITTKADPVSKQDMQTKKHDVKSFKKQVT